jgi:hypothetical protein
MSYCEIITFRDGKPDQSQEFGNSWGGAAFIWDCLFNKYLKDPRKEYDSWLGNAGSSSSSLWKLHEREGLPRFERAVHMATYDRAIVEKRDFPQFIKDLLDFADAYESGRTSHLRSWAKFIQEHPDVQAVGFYMTSVSENLWYDWDEATETMILYDCNTEKKHFSVYRQIERIESEMPVAGTT